MNLKEELVNAVGPEGVLDGPEDMEAYVRGLSAGASQVPNYVVSAENTDQAQRVVRLANERKIPVVPTSSTVHARSIACSQGGVVLDLSRMNRILSHDQRNRKVRIEPGVTWGQLGAELEKHRMMTVNPLLPHAGSSVVTSCLEREPLLNAMFEYGEQILSLELIWPTGELFRTGTASAVNYPEGLGEGSYPYGPGTLDPLRLLQGAQGTMGVVTWANIKTEYLPEVNKAFLIPFDRTEDLAEATYAILRRRIGRECLALSNLNLAAILAKNWPGDFETLRRALPPWSLLIVLAGPRWFPEEKIAYEEEALREVRGTVFPFAEILEVVPGYGSTRNLPALLRRPWPEDTPYWKHRYKGSCQDLFFITKLERARQFVEAIQRQAALHGYNPNDMGLYIQPINYAAAAHLEFNFYFDAADAEQASLVERLFAAAISEALRLEAHFTRPYGRLMSDLVYEKTAGYTALLKKAKHVLDPNHIMNPGTLCF